MHKQRTLHIVDGIHSFVDVTLATSYVQFTTKATGPIRLEVKEVTLEEYLRAKLAEYKLVEYITK